MPDCDVIGCSEPGSWLNITISDLVIGTIICEKHQEIIKKNPFGRFIRA